MASHGMNDLYPDLYLDEAMVAFGNVWRLSKNYSSCVCKWSEVEAIIYLPSFAMANKENDPDLDENIVWEWFWE